MYRNKNKWRMKIYEMSNEFKHNKQSVYLCIYKNKFQYKRRERLSYINPLDGIDFQNIYLTFVCTCVLCVYSMRMTDIFQFQLIIYLQDELNVLGACVCVCMGLPFRCFFTYIFSRIQQQISDVDPYYDTFISRRSLDCSHACLLALSLPIRYSEQ